MSYELDPEQRKKIQKEYQRGREAIIIFLGLSAIIVLTFVLTLIFV